MQTFDGTYLTHQSRRQSTLPSVLLVGSLHVAAIYTLLVALDVVQIRPPRFRQSIFARSRPRQ